MLHCGVCFKSYCKWFFITYNGYLLIIVLNIDLTVLNIEDGKQTNIEHYWKIYWIWHYLIIMEQILRKMCFSRVMVMKLGRNWVLLSYQRFKILVHNILDITSFDIFSLDIPREPEIIFDFSLSSFGVVSTIINLKSSNDFFL